MRLAVFKAGRHTDSSGASRDWSESDLDVIASQYNESGHEAPAVIGHPKDNAPAYGWVKKTLQRVGDVLYADIEPTVAEFADWLKQGLYKKRSISLYPDMTLKHIGFLGAVPPAVKGLPDFAFSDAGAAVIEFEEVSHEELRDKLYKALNPDDKGGAWVREVFPDKAIIEDGGQLYECPYSVAEDGKVTMGQKKVKVAYVPDEGEAPKEAEKPKGAEAEKPKAEAEPKEAEMSEKVSGLEVTLKEKDAEIARLKASERRSAHASFIEGLEKEGRLTPAMRPALMDFLEVLSGVETFEFAEGDTKKASPPVEKFKGFLSGLPKAVEFGEIAKKDKAGAGGIDLTDPELIAKAAVEFKEAEKKAGREISVSRAVAHITKGGS